MRRILLFLFIFISLTSCNSPLEESSIPKHEYSEVITMQIDYLDVFKMGKGRYYIYYYQTTCYHCHGIKSKVLDFAIHSSDPFYFIEITEDKGFLSRSKEDTIGTNEPLKAFALMTPQLSIVNEGKIIETYIGVEEILNAIEY